MCVHVPTDTHNITVRLCTHRADYINMRIKYARSIYYNIILSKTYIGTYRRAPSAAFP